tara:strand:+ start:363 stop:584 length:222 start_codon:yes stop_codon:yes gene_type:complete
MTKYKNFEIRKGNLLEFTYHNPDNDLTGSSYDKDIWVIESEDEDLIDSGMDVWHYSFKEAKEHIDDFMEHLDD